MNTKDVLMKTGYAESEADQVLALADGEARAKLRKAGKETPTEAEISNIAGPIVMLAVDLGTVRRTHNTRFEDILYILGEKAKE